MAFEFIFTTEEIREKIFNFLKENDKLLEYNDINWRYAVLSDKVKEGINFYCVYDFIDDFFDIVKEKSEELDKISKEMEKRRYNSES